MKFFILAMVFGIIAIMIHLIEGDVRYIIHCLMFFMFFEGMFLGNLIEKERWRK